MNCSNPATATSFLGVAIAISGFALPQDIPSGPQTTPPVPRHLTSPSAVAEPGNTPPFALADEKEGSAKLSTSKPVATAEEKIAAALAADADVQFTDTPLKEAIAEIAGRHQINAVIDELALDDVNLQPDVAVTLKLSGVPLESSLHYMLRPLDLTWTVHKGVLLITSTECADRLLITNVYDVSDLVKCQDKDGEKWSDFDTLIELVTSTIQPDSWDEVGGPGSIEAAPFGHVDMLAISQPYQTHTEIERLLNAMRKLTRKTSTQELPVREKPCWNGVGMGNGMMGRGSMGSVPNAGGNAGSSDGDGTKEHTRTE